MNNFEYEGERVIMLGINAEGEYYVETRTGNHIVEPYTKLEAGAMYIEVQEVAGIYDVSHPGQNVINPLRRG